MNDRSKNIDTQILMVTNLTGGQIPLGTLSQIARMNNVSREWVRQRANKLQTIPNRTIKSGHISHCQVCSKKIESKTGKKRYCSSKCYRVYCFKKYYVSIKCKLCGKEKFYQKSDTRPHIYCSKQCLGKANGLKYGRAGFIQWAKQRNSIYPKTREELIKDLGNEFTSVDFAKKFKICYSTALLRITNYRVKDLIKIKKTEKNKSIYIVL